MELLRFLQDWYLSQCDGDWEHQLGIDIGTIDNPGWTVKVSLSDYLLLLNLFMKLFTLARSREASGFSFSLS